MTLSSKQIDLIKANAKQYPDGKQASSVIYALMVAQQGNEGFLTEELVTSVANILAMPVISVKEVATFYTMFNFAKPKKYQIKVCNGISCWLKGYKQIKHKLEKTINNDKQLQNLFAIEETECIAACTKAPCMLVNETYHENLATDNLQKILKDYKNNE